MRQSLSTDSALLHPRYYQSTQARGKFKGRVYRVNWDRNRVEFLAEEGTKWDKSMYSCKELVELVKQGKMVEGIPEIYRMVAV
jgi:hypothetical protein